MTDKPKRGRKPLEPDQIKSARTELRSTEIDKAVWQACATAAGIPLNQWLEGAANAQARKELRKGK